MEIPVRYRGMLPLLPYRRCSFSFPPLIQQKAAHLLRAEKLLKIHVTYFCVQ
jgi:hypothetical protein